MQKGKMGARVQTFWASNLLKTKIDGSSADQNFKTLKAKSCAKSACGRRKKKKKRNIFLLFETSAKRMAGWRVRGKPLTHCLHVRDERSLKSTGTRRFLLNPQFVQWRATAAYLKTAVQAFHCNGILSQRDDRKNDTQRLQSLHSLCESPDVFIYLFILIILFFFFYPSARPSSHLSRRSLSACHFQCSWYF